ncbi:MAG: 3-hydroxyacyl-CoA dehydrogenase family protein [Rhizobiales bacterium]|nr:3-hydroxyacyl-CoA dehydrogenase family protein [Hyphomicrobiales bacterium]
MPEFKSIAILGAGLMGHGLAIVHALGGCGVRLYDNSPKALAEAPDKIAAALHTLAEAGDITQEEATAAKGRIGYERDVGRALAGSDMVVEAIVEDMEAKRRFYGEIADRVPDNAVFASNTSFLDIFPAVPERLRPRAFIIHWYTPPYIVDLVDVVAGERVPEELASRVMDFLRGLGKQPVRLKRFISGYIANRIQMAIESEIFRLLDAGVAEVADIDTSIRHGLALRLALLGQFRKIDYTGLRVVRDSHANHVYDPPTFPTTTKRLDELLAAGHAGVSTGAGFYDYTGKSAIDLFRKRDRDLLALKKLVRASEETKS